MNGALALVWGEEHRDERAQRRRHEGLELGDHLGRPFGNSQEELCACEACLHCQIALATKLGQGVDDDLGGREDRGVVETRGLRAQAFNRSLGYPQEASFLQDVSYGGAWRGPFIRILRMARVWARQVVRDIRQANEHHPNVSHGGRKGRQIMSG